MKLTYFYRNPACGGYGIERIFDLVAEKLPSDIQVTKAYSSHMGAGMRGVFANIREATGRQGDVNHITGDIYYVAMKLDMRKTITTIHDLGNLEKLSGLKRSIFKRIWFDMPVARSRIVTTVSEFSRQEILRRVKCDPGKVRVIYVPMDPRYKPLAKPFDRAKPSILMLGWVWNKNTERQLEALEGIPCRVTLVGKPSEAVLDAARRHRIDFRSVTNLSDEEMVQQYVECDLVLFASLLEGFGMPIAEGNAVGRPVITGDRTSMPEVAGDAALCVDPTDISAIRDAVQSVIEDAALRERLVAAGFENVKRFELGRIASQYADLYREIVPG